MAQRDPAFLWETEALRTAPQPAAPTRRQDPVRSHGDWLTLREANELTGVPVATLRKWARRESVPSYLEETPAGQLRMVSLQGIYRRAEELGREVERGSQVIDLTRQEEVGSSVTKAEVPEGTMLVPLDAWNKMLNQLGNLHEAGQQLAEARERAAKAETEATFLRERLAEMRAELAGARPESPAEQPATNASANVTPSTWRVLRDLVAAWSRRRKD